jgi:hypothetical protein
LRKSKEGGNENQQEKMEINKIFKNYRFFFKIRKNKKTINFEKTRKRNQKNRNFQIPKSLLKNHFK